MSQNSLQFRYNIIIITTLITAKLCSARLTVQLKHYHQPFLT